ncbi:sensor histidine kinase [Ancylobacter terrae]|uniref:sensor histidine kinase n=1 Tax=Ancylobacter sp. sgz301288 TaxID=3342077 RepID=UPI00385CD103
MSAETARPLGRLVASRIVLFAAIAMLAQLVAVLLEYGRDPDNLARLMLEQETSDVAAGLSRHGTRLAFELPPALAERYDRIGSGYVARVRTAGGAVLFSHCDAACTDHFLPLDVHPPDFWLRRTAPGFPLSIAGGRTVGVGDRAVFIEIAIDRDPGRAVWGVMAEEALDHMLVPMSLTLIFVLGATLLSIRAALRPVAQAAEAADRLDPLNPDARLDVTGMPREIARLVGAVNRSLERTRRLMDAQKLFTSAIAHEIRTPLAVIRLELERIDHPRAARARDELDELTRFLEQLVMLARLEATDRAGFATVRLDDLLEEVVGALAPFVYAHGASIALEGSDNRPVAVHPALLKDAIRNLVENAVRHGGPGVAVTVAAHPDASITVTDDGTGFAPAPKVEAPGHYRSSGGLGIGLEIVRRIAALHGGTLEIGPATPRGTRARIILPPPA